MSRKRNPHDAIIDKRPGYVLIFNEAQRRIYAIEPPKLYIYLLAVYHCLVQHSNNDTEESFPSYATIARETRIARSTAIRCVQLLEEHGLITVTPRQDAHGDRTSNLYAIVFNGKVVHDTDYPVRATDQGGSQNELHLVRDKDPNNYPIKQEEINENSLDITEQHSFPPAHLRAAFAALGVTSVGDFIRIAGCGPFHDHDANLALLAKKRGQQRFL